MKGVDTCCGCCSLKTGSMLIAFFQFFGYMLISIASWRSAFLLHGTDNEYPAYFLAGFSTIGVIFSLTFLQGLKVGNTSIITFWIRLMLLLTIAELFVFMFYHYEGLTSTLIQLYFIAVVHSYRDKLRAEQAPTRSRDHGLTAVCVTQPTSTNTSNNQTDTQPSTDDCPNYSVTIQRDSLFKDDPPPYDEAIKARAQVLDQNDFGPIPPNNCDMPPKYTSQMCLNQVDTNIASSNASAHISPAVSPVPTDLPGSTMSSENPPIGFNLAQNSPSDNSNTSACNQSNGDSQDNSASK